MVSSKGPSSIYDIKLSTVAPGLISGKDKAEELTAMDLAMKLHYLRSVYYFRTPAFDGLTIMSIKETLFNWLNHAFVPCGRLRRADSGWPYIKCNDCGVRLIEARCHLSLDEWLESKDDSIHKSLVPNQVIGPDLTFSPLVLMQLTKFKCGGTSVGVSWAHVLGDAFSAVAFIVLWGRIIAGRHPAQPLTMAQSETGTCNSQGPSPDPLSVKRVGPVGDLWSTPNNSKMQTFSFHVSMDELTRLQSKICQEKAERQIPTFECICAVIWQCMARIVHGPGPQVVTICKNDSKDKTKGVITNRNQTISVVQTDVSVTKASPLELGLIIADQATDERMKIEDAMGRGGELLDFLIYGANLTFVDMSDVPFYEMEVRGQKPVYVNCVIDNVGDAGVVLVLPAPKGGRVINMTLAENQVSGLKSMLKKDWCIA